MTRQRLHPLAAWTLGLLLGSACAQPVDPLRYRLTESGERWDVSGSDAVLDDLIVRYPDFFQVVLDPERSDEAPTEGVRDDLEKEPVDRANYDALNAVAIAYYEINGRGEEARRSGDLEFMSAGFRAAKIVAVPWRAYMEIDDGSLRNATVLEGSIFLVA